MVPTVEAHLARDDRRAKRSVPPSSSRSQLVRDSVGHENHGWTKRSDELFPAIQSREILEWAGVLPAVCDEPFYAIYSFSSNLKARGRTGPRFW